MYKVGLYVRMPLGVDVTEARKVMVKLAKETRRELEFMCGDSSDLYLFVCKEEFTDFLRVNEPPAPEGAHEAASHLFRNFSFVCPNPLVDYEMVFNDGTMGWENPYLLAVSFALANRDKARRIVELEKRLADLESRSAHDRRLLALLPGSLGDSRRAAPVSCETQEVLPAEPGHDWGGD